MAAAMYYRHEPWAFPRQLGIVLGLNMLIQILAVIVIPSYAIDWQSRWHGLTTHPNTLGAMAFTTLWANAAVLISKKSYKPILHWIFALAAVVAMVGADSVTSMMVSLTVVMLIYLFSMLNRRGAGQRFYVSVFIIAVLIVLIVTLIGSTFDVSGLFKLFGRDSDFTGRTSIWEDALKAIQKHPLLGWSFDDHAFLIQQGMAFPSYHNGYLDIAVSGGMVSVILVAFLFATWAIGFAKPSRIAKQIAPFSASYVIAYLIHNLTESSLIAPRGQLWQIFLVLVFLGTCKKWRVVSRKYDKLPALTLPPLQIDTMGVGEFKHNRANSAHIGI
jgi:O-antigen ligase